MVDLQPLIHTHKGLSISLRNFSSSPWEIERRGGTLTCLLPESKKMGREVRRKKATVAQIPQFPTVKISSPIPQLMLPKVRFSSPNPHWKFQCG